MMNLGFRKNRLSSVEPTAFGASLVADSLLAASASEKPDIRVLKGRWSPVTMILVRNLNLNFFGHHGPSVSARTSMSSPSIRQTSRCTILGEILSHQVDLTHLWFSYAAR